MTRRETSGHGFSMYDDEVCGEFAKKLASLIATKFDEAFPLSLVEVWVDTRSHQKMHFIVYAKPEKDNRTSS